MIRAGKQVRKAERHTTGTDLCMVCVSPVDTVAVISMTRQTNKNAMTMVSILSSVDGHDLDRKMV